MWCQQTWTQPRASNAAGTSAPHQGRAGGEEVHGQWSLSSAHTPHQPPAQMYISPGKAEEMCLTGAGRLPRAAGVASSRILAGFASHNRKSRGHARKTHQTLPQQDLARRFPQAAINGKLAEKSRW